MLTNIKPAKKLTTNRNNYSCHNKTVKILFLCGGTGKRMFPLTEDKFLLNFLGRTLLEHQINLAQKAGFREFVIVGNPARMARIEQSVSQVKHASIELCEQKKPLGMADAIVQAHPHLHSHFIVVNPNDIFDISAYTNLLAAHEHKGNATLILSKKTDSYFPGGYLITGKGNVVRKIVEKPGAGKEPSNLVNIVVHLHPQVDALIEIINKQPKGNDDIYERALNELANRTGKLHTVIYSGDWIAIKYPWHVLDAIRFFLDKSRTRVSPKAWVSSSATIDGKVIIEPGVKILENAVIRGPVYIGKNTIIGNNCLVREYSHIGNNCIIGFGTEIKNSYLGDRCQTHMNYIGDSVIGENCSFGAGTITANRRLDEKQIRVKAGAELVDTGKDKLGAIIGNNCRTGIHVSIMPGIKIGPDIKINPGTIVKRDIISVEKT